jgi:serine protease Do
MRKFVVAAILIACSALVAAEPSEELVAELRDSMVKVHVDTRNGGRGLGSGVVVSQNFVATNCHVLANGRGVSITKFGENHIPVALRADWKHDLCLLRFEQLPLKPVILGDSESLRYEQSVFSLGFPLGSPRPLATFGRIKALYPLDDSEIIRASSSFRLGASGSAMLDENGHLIGINTFKSPGRNSYFYSLPVKWIKQLLFSTNEVTSLKQEMLPFWDAPEEERPFFMRVVPHLLGERWLELGVVAKAWAEAEPDNAEAWYYQGLALERQGSESEAGIHYQKALALNPEHADALFEIGMIASRQGNEAELQRVDLLLNGLNSEAAEELRRVATPLAH